jgi:hypothetical protein
MSRAHDVQSLVVQVEAGDMDEESLDELTRSLLAEVRELDVGTVQLLGGDSVPTGAKTAEALTVGAMVIAILPTCVSKLMDLLLSWSGRSAQRRVRVKTQIGDRAVEVEFTPDSLSGGELVRLVDLLSGALHANSSGEGPSEAPAGASLEA